MSSSGSSDAPVARSRRPRPVSYSLRLVETWLKQQGWTRYKYASPEFDMCTRIEHGLRIQSWGDMEISVQTHPVVAGPAFAETALIYRGTLLYSKQLEYPDCRHHADPADLFAHLKQLHTQLDGYREVRALHPTYVLRLRTGQEVSLYRNLPVDEE